MQQSTTATVLPPAPAKLAPQKAQLAPDELQTAIPALDSLCKAHFVSQCLFTVVALRIPDIIGGGTLSFEDIVGCLGCTVNEDLLLRQLRLVASQGILTESAGDNGEFVYQLTAAGKLLQTGVPDQPSLAAGVLHQAGPALWQAWGKLPNATCGNDVVPFVEANGCSSYEYFEKDAAAGTAFNDHMTFVSSRDVGEVMDSYDWSTCKGKTVCDIGGSYGKTMGVLKAKYPEIRTLSMDLPKVIDAITDPPKGVEFVKGDIFDSTTIPACDVAFLKRVFHAWSDKVCSKVLQSLSTALPPHATLLIADRVIPPPGGAHSLSGAKKTYLNCLMGVMGGKERTLAEWTQLLSSNGWNIQSVGEGKTLSIIAAVKS